uniref:Nicotinate phosphoribosyltransferase n=1 Tax=Candidatus Aschnera chinzeii TaxID=1485666 RepID=A0AAT9G537_9ENTR|nr:MAG: nicotinate phosphoribosyltransferase [Candidatus Aschnera chinzeii]
MNLNTSPIITSLLDNDAYKFHMQQAIFHQHKTVRVVAEFICRDNNLLGDYVNVVQQQINLMQDISLTSVEYEYLYQLSIYKKDYLNWLKTFRFKPHQVHVYKTINNQLAIKIIGLWYEIILWEVPILSIISELVYSDRYPSITIENVIDNCYISINNFYKKAFSEKIDLKNFKIIDFGTRRRLSKKIHYKLIKKLHKFFPYFKGTSNYNLSLQFKIDSFGTQAHEWFQAHQQLCSQLCESQRLALYNWLKEYPDKLGIALTDCITMDVFLKDFDHILGTKYQGLRHDSGNPLEWGEKAIKHYKKLNIDPMNKTLVFSDNINLQKALLIYKHFHNRINIIFGIGAGLSCNIPKIELLNIVIKLIQCNGHPVAKLSDTPEKTICNDNNFIEYLKKVYKIM